MIIVKTKKDDKNVEYVDTWQTLPKAMCVGATKTDGVYAFTTNEIPDTVFYQAYKQFYVKDGRLFRDYEKIS